MKGLAYYSSPVGELSIESEHEKITAIAFVKDAKLRENPTSIIDQCLEELDEYFYRGRKFFSFPLCPIGTDFQLKVWRELETIPYGKTLSYETIAVHLGNIKSIRAVGLANRQNPIAIVLPCHRVIGKNGDLVGYGGGLEKKTWLLQHEGVFHEQLSLF